MIKRINAWLEDNPIFVEGLLAVAVWVIFVYLFFQGIFTLLEVL